MRVASSLMVQEGAGTLEEERQEREAHFLLHASYLPFFFTVDEGAQDMRWCVLCECFVNAHMLKGHEESELHCNKVNRVVYVAKHVCYITYIATDIKQRREVLNQRVTSFVTVNGRWRMACKTRSGCDY